jgi:hypothetical protein
MRHRSGGFEASGLSVLCKVTVVAAKNGLEASMVSLPTVAT